jgi:hypothetical protein
MGPPPFLGAEMNSRYLAVGVPLGLFCLGFFGVLAFLSID